MKRLTLTALCLAVLTLAIPAVAGPTIAYINHIPNQSVADGALFTYNASYTVQNEGCFATAVFSLVSGPSGMTVSPSGAISWQTPYARRDYSVTIKMIGVSDCLGVGSSTDFETFTISVC